MMLHRSTTRRPGIALLSLGSVAAGVFDLRWREFEPAHQPIGALGDHIPGQRALAILAAVVLIGAGLAILRRRTIRAGAGALAAIYLVFALFWLPRFVTVPRFLGYHASLYIGLLDGVATQLIVVVAAVLLFAAPYVPGEPPPRHLLSGTRWTFGLCAISFGLGHLTAVNAVGTMIPRWMPLGASLWVVLSGVAFLLAGLAILSGIHDVLAAQLMALMLLLFSLLVLLRLPFANPGNHVAWGANAYNLAAIGATLIVADSLALVRTRSRARAPSAQVLL